MFARNLATLSLCILPAFAAPSPPVKVRRSTDPIRGRYIVTLKEGANRQNHIDSCRNVTHEWDRLVNGFAGFLNDDEVNTLSLHPEVHSIEEDGVVRAQSTTTQLDATWGLGRLSSQIRLTNQDSSALKFSYKYDDSAGSGSDIYVIDTGVDIYHPAFGGRAVWGATFGGYQDFDGNGHGTHMAGTAASDPYGVSKRSCVIAVKALNNYATGSLSDVISAMDWTAGAASKSGRPSVALLGFANYGYVESINAAAERLVYSGVSTVVAAGNGNVDAGDWSPSSTPSVFTVGAAKIDDARSTYSNFGPVVDIYSSGDDIISTWTDGGSKSLSGTSMASAHVAGYAAYILTLDPSLTPSQVGFTMLSQSLKGVLANIPSGSINSLLNNGL